MQKVINLLRTHALAEQKGFFFVNDEKEMKTY